MNMEVRDIKNSLGEVIGQLELPENTPEEIWQEKLAFFLGPMVEEVPNEE